MVTIAATFTARYTIVISSLLVLLSYRMIDGTLPLNKKMNELQRLPNTIRIATWNVNQMGDCRVIADSANSDRNLVFRHLKALQVDVACLQDFGDYNNPHERSNYKDMFARAGFKYAYYPSDYKYDTVYGNYNYGAAIFSKWPIIDSSKLRIVDGNYPEHALIATININGKKIKCINFHLLSYNLQPLATLKFQPRYNQSDASVVTTNNKLLKIAHFEAKHYQQALLIKQTLAKEQLPYIIACDANAIPAMHTYQILTKNVSDAWAKSGFGFGATYKSALPYMRIDYLLGSSHIQWQRAAVLPIGRSDHYPLIADFTLRK
jgi:endonuclease/exonuclease/phosphatase family metal-dependent hydrolase